MTLTWKHCNLPKKMTWLQIRTTKYQRINTQLVKFKIDNEHLKNITKINKYNKLNMTGHKADINITKI